ncbi:sigma-70 family RNA polymerase sigma factor [Algoriphagus kandeliae]|uniref:Sigma-70 family RNA polymerase sigma factor n=1 Tax=Algoriphagus kandeliae TaxID=2562278 RepID=A0A4Y9QT08_9BACT|nr:sigma-70 family RNA polymerase sigma factor [Algoriphagus kandeliae]TFV95559.1 sigma-70 family RNA polymerase sigma factor [Algoriphagus kandeliae]
MQSAKDIEKEFIAKIEKHQGILHKVCFVYAKDAADRKDLYQEMVLQLWKSYPNFRGNAAFSTWMYRVALNTAITQTKRPKLLTVNTEIPSLLDDVEATMDASEDVKILYRAISQLNKIEKAIILLWLDEKSYEEIAETIGISVKNVSVKLVRIKTKLADLIQKLQ